MIVVIPTRREIRLDYLEQMIASGARFIIVDDTEGTIHIDHPQFQVYNWGAKRRIAGKYEEAFPGLNGACMSFGFYMAWRESDDDEIILTLGDDCRLDEPGFPGLLRDALSHKRRRVATTPSRFINYVENIEGVSPSLFTRGFPYSARANHVPFEAGESVESEVAFNLGCFQNIQDINAIDKIVNPPPFTFPEAKFKHDALLIPPGKLLSVSSGNMQFRRRLIPAVYQLPMHFKICNDWVIDRFGDIWGGFILKSLMDKAGDGFSIGRPSVFHVLPGYVDQNIWKEHICNLVNDEFIALLDESVADLKPGRYEEMIAGLRDAFRARADRCSVLLQPYLLHLCRAWDAWVSALLS